MPFLGWRLINPNGGSTFSPVIQMSSPSVAPRSLPYGTAQSVDADDFSTKKKWYGRRHLVAVLALLGFANIYAMRANLSIAIVEMTSGYDRHVNGTIVHVPAEFGHWSFVTQGVILSAFFYGYILTQLPGGYLAYKYGGKTTFFAGTFGTAVFTIMTPPLAKMGYGALILARFFEGVLEGVTYPAMHVVWSHWAPAMEKTKLATFAFSGSYFGTVVAMPLSAYIGEGFGWPGIFLFFGIVGMVWCAVWQRTVYDRPADDVNISTDELTLLQRDAISECQYVVPWREILRSKAVWAVIMAHFSQNWGFYTMLTNLPRFLKDVADYDIEKAGVASALPYFLMGVTIIAGGHFADYLRKERQFDTIFVRKAFCTSGFLAQSLFLVIVSQTTNPTILVICISLSIGLGGVCWAGFSVNHLDLAPQYAGHLMALSNTIATIPGIFCPLFVGFIVSTGAVVEWHFILYTIILVYILGAFVFWKFADAALQPWAGDHHSFVGQLE
ncbi:unnamed protein product [Caenorhabditis auriculariae]|uniref:Sialin n=1 Tax=Caenorhabditis auriculariae TaxID=2777116 RepID=A0A8S1H2N2_9PELO|nr:unnamed protein product [Caenorhabditis auriculariae]